MIGQNRQAAFQQSKSDHDYRDVDQLLVENTDLTRQINRLTAELHHHLLGRESSAAPEQTDGSSSSPADS